MAEQVHAKVGQQCEDVLSRGTLWERLLLGIQHKAHGVALVGVSS